jgi:hypothetical protein
MFFSYWSLWGRCNLILRKVSLQLARELAVLFEPVWYLRKFSLGTNLFIVNSVAPETVLLSNIIWRECVIYDTDSLWSWKTLCRARSKWEDNIKIDLKEIRLKGLDWIHQAQNRGQWQAHVSTVINLWIPYNAGNFLTSWTAVSSSRRICFTELRVLLTFVSSWVTH